MSTIAGTFLQDRVTAKAMLITAMHSGVAKAWCRINQVPAVQAYTGSFNAGSLTDSGVGVSSVALTVPLANITSSCCTAIILNSNANIDRTGGIMANASTLSVVSLIGTATLTDFSVAQSTVFGDLA